MVGWQALVLNGLLHPELHSPIQKYFYKLWEWISHFKTRKKSKQTDEQGPDFDDLKL